MDSQELKKAFTIIYADNYWGGRVSRSGKGSDPEQTRVLVHLLSEFVLRNAVRTLIDLGCGDRAWIGPIVDQLDQYTGVDIVSGLATVEADVTRFVIPKADAVICRDVLCHLEYADALRLVTNVKKSQSTWFISTTFIQPGRTNPEVPQGPLGWYPPVLTMPPFNFPTPEQVLVENAPDVGFEDKALGVWRVAELP